MAKKQDFTGANTGRVYAGIEQAAAKKNKQPALSPQEEAERKSKMETQGRAGAKADRINMAFSTENLEYVRIMAAASGVSMTKYVNDLISKYRTANPEIYEDAKRIVERARAIVIPDGPK